MIHILEPRELHKSLPEDSAECQQAVIVDWVQKRSQQFPDKRWRLCQNSAAEDPVK